MTTYPIIGASTGAVRAITSSLGDLPEKSTFYIGWDGEPSPGEEAVIDWLIDHERTFTVVHTTETVPKGISKYAEACIATKGNLSSSVVTQAIIDGASTCLVLWSDDVSDDIIAISSHISKFLELTNGLTPIEVDDSDEEDEDVPAAVVEEDEAPAPPAEDEGFSRDELASMPMAALKRQAKERGIAFSGMTKEELVDALLSHDGTVGEDEQPPVVVLPPAAGTGDLEFIRGLVDEVKKIDKQWSECEAVIADLLAERRSLMQKISESLGLEDGIL